MMSVIVVRSAGTGAVLCVLGTIFACQAMAAEVYVEQIGGVGNYARVHQTGLFPESNAAQIETDGKLTRGLSVRIRQGGDLNVTLVRQIGRQNHVGSLEAQQAGVGNFGSLIQINTEAFPVGGTASGGRSRLELLQRGENNVGYLVQRGTNNQMVGEQNGIANDAEAIQGGTIPSNFNLVDFRQFGAEQTVRISQD